MHVVALLSELKKYVRIEVEDEWLFDWAEDIVRDYWWFRMEDIILALKQGAKQKQYGAVLLSDIFQWLDAYEKKRQEYHVKRNNQMKEHGSSERSSSMTVRDFLKSNLNENL